MERNKQRIFGNSGELMLESIVVYTITLFLLFFILALFSVLYQRWNIQTIANETAARMAQTYRFESTDASSGYVTKEQLTQTSRGFSLYRNILGFNKESDLKPRVSSYAKGRLARTTYTKNVVEPTFDVIVKHDAMGRRHVELTITGEYSVPFGEALVFFGFPGTITYEVKAYAECLDLIDYINYVDFVKEQTGLGQIKGSIIKSADAVIGVIDSAVSLFKKVTGI